MFLWLLEQQEPSVSLLPKLSSVQTPTPLRGILPSKLKKHSVSTLKIRQSAPSRPAFPALIIRGYILLKIRSKDVDYS